MLSVRSIRLLKNISKRTYISHDPAAPYAKRFQFKFRHAYTFPYNEPNQVKENQTVWDSQSDKHGNQIFNLARTYWNRHNFPCKDLIFVFKLKL